MTLTHFLRNEKINVAVKRRTTSAQDRLLIRKYKINPKLSAVGLASYLGKSGLDIHVTTVRLLEVGRPARKPVKKQLLTKLMCKKRLEWAKMHENFGQWKKVIFSDECHFEVHGH